MSGSTTVDFDLHGLAGVRLVDPSPGDLAAVARQLGPLPRVVRRDLDLVIRFVDPQPTTRLRQLGKVPVPQADRLRDVVHHPVRRQVDQFVADVPGAGAGGAQQQLRLAALGPARDEDADAVELEGRRVQRQRPVAQDRQVEDGDEERDRGQPVLADDLRRSTDAVHRESDADRLLPAAQDEEGVVRPSRLPGAEVAQTRPELDPIGERAKLRGIRALVDLAELFEAVRPMIR